jgi:hypothetical protein
LFIKVLMTKAAILVKGSKWYRRKEMLFKITS